MTEKCGICGGDLPPVELPAGITSMSSTGVRVCAQCGAGLALAQQDMQRRAAELESLRPQAPRLGIWPPSRLMAAPIPWYRRWWAQLWSQANR